MEPKIESKITYDDRRKELLQHFKSSQEIKMNDEVVGEAVVTREAIFKKDGIKKILKELSVQRTNYEQRIKQLKDSLTDAEELTPELVELEKNIQIINDFNKNKKTKAQLETQESELKTVKKDIQDIKDYKTNKFSGVLIGTALHDGSINIEELRKILKS